MIIRRRVKHKFTALPRAAFEDARLSYEARGVLGYILVKPDNWRVHVTDLARQAGPKGCGKDRIYRILDELKAAGYMTYSQGKAARGKFGAAEYVISDTPVEMADQPDTENPDTADFPDTDQPDTDQPDTENPDAYKELTSTNYEFIPSTKNFSGVAGANDAPAEVAPLAPADIPAGGPSPAKVRKPRAPKTPDPLAVLAENIMFDTTGRMSTPDRRHAGLVWPLVGDIRAMVGDNPPAAVQVWMAFCDAQRDSGQWQYVQAHNARDRFGRWAANGGGAAIEQARAMFGGAAGEGGES